MTTIKIIISSFKKVDSEKKKYAKLLEGCKVVKEYRTWYGKYVVIMKKEIKNG